MYVCDLLDTYIYKYINMYKYILFSGRGTSDHSQAASVSRASSNTTTPLTAAALPVPSMGGGHALGGGGAGPKSPASSGSMQVLE
jgi:hypothetical protein